MSASPFVSAAAPDAAVTAAIAAACERLRDEATEMLAALVREPSTMGHEAGAQKLMAGAFAGLGLAVETFAVEDAAIRDLPGYSPALAPYDETRRNVVGIHRPKTVKGRSLIFNGHIDVVPPGDPARWTSQPFAPEIRGGRLYGRGAGDMKAGLVAYVTAMKAVRSLGLAPAAPVFLQSVIEEECTGNGALACLARGYRADAAVIPEPFNQTLLTAEVGVMWAEIAVTGRAAHMIDRSEGLSAIDAALIVAEHLKALETAWNAARHPAFAHVPHPINFNLGRIAGGEWTSSVPETCVTHWRLSFYPGMSAAEMRAAVTAAVEGAIANDARLSGCTARIRWQGFQAEGFETDPAGPMMRLLAETHREVAGTPAPELACTCTTDARFFALYAGTPATCYGPEATSIHTTDESVSLASLAQVTRVLALFMARWCGLEPLD